MFHSTRLDLQAAADVPDLSEALVLHTRDASKDLTREQAVEKL